MVHHVCYNVAPPLQLQIAEWIEETPLGLTPEMEELHSILSKPYLRVSCLVRCSKHISVDK